MKRAGCGMRKETGKMGYDINIYICMAAAWKRVQARVGSCMTYRQLKYIFYSKLF